MESVNSVSPSGCWSAQFKPSANNKFCSPRHHCGLFDYFIPNHKFPGESFIAYCCYEILGMVKIKLLLLFLRGRERERRIHAWLGDEF